MMRSPGIPSQEGGLSGSGVKRFIERLMRPRFPRQRKRVTRGT